MCSLSDAGLLEACLWIARSRQAVSLARTHDVSHYGRSTPESCRRPGAGKLAGSDTVCCSNQCRLEMVLVFVSMKITPGDL